MKIIVNNIELKNVRRGIPLTLSKDEELNVGTLIFVNTQAKEYDPFTKIKFYLDETSAPILYVLLSDTSIRKTNFPPFLYEHTFSIIEPIKELEKYMVDDITFTQPLNETQSRYSIADVIKRIRAITPLETYDQLESTRLFEISSTINNLTMNAPQFTLKGNNLLQSIIEVLKYVNGFPKINSYATNKLPILDLDYLNSISGTKVIKNITGETNQNNLEYFGNKLDMAVENATTNRTVIYPPNPNYATLTTKQTIMSTNDLSLILPDKIYAIKKLSMHIIYNEKKPELWSPHLTYQDFDLTDFLYEKDAFDLLPLQQSGVPSKYGSLYYEKGTNVINNFGISFPVLWGLFSTTTLEFIMNNNIPNLVVTMPNGQKRTFAPMSPNSDLALDGSYGFKVEYWPYVNQRINVYKQDLTYNNNYAIYANQSGVALDMERLGNNAQGMINRMGMSDNRQEKVIKNYSDVFHLGEKNNDEIVTVVENNIESPEIIRSLATSNKNFNRLSQYVGVDRDFRQYEIPFGATINRNLIYNEFCILTFDNYDGDRSSLWKDSAIENFSKMFAYNYYTYGNYTIRGIVFSPQAISDQAKIHTPKKYFYKSIVKSGYSNSSIFYFSFSDATIAYYEPGTPTSENIFDQLLTIMKPVRYTYFNEDNQEDLLNGSLEAMSLSFYDNDPINALIPGVMILSAANSADAIAQYINRFPATSPYVYFQLSTDWTDSSGSDWEYIGIRIASYPLPNKSADAEILGFTKEFVLSDIMNQSTLFGQVDPINDKFSTYYSQYPMIKNQNETNPILWLKTSEGYIKDLYILKDPTESISMTYQLHFISDNSNIVVGNYLGKKNPFVVARNTLIATELNLYVYRSASQYGKTDQYAKGERLPMPYLGFNVSNVSNKINILCQASLSGYNSWSIADENGNLYFAVNRDNNGILKNNINFYFKNKL